MIFERMFGTVSTVSVPLIAFSTTSFHTSLTSTTFAAGDTKISQNYGGFTNTATTPTGDPSNFMMILTLTAAEMSAAHIEIRIVDSATKVWEDQLVVIETYGTTTAQHAFNRHQTVVAASLTAAQAGVTIATVTQVTNQVQASLTAAQTGVTIATVTNVTGGVNLTTTAILNNLAASATAQINAEVDTALADASVTAAAMNRIHDATAGATAVWAMTQSAFTVGGTFGDNLDATVSGLSTFNPSTTGVTGTAAFVAQINAEADAALADASVTAAAMNRIHDATTGASAVFGFTMTSSSFNADTAGQRLTAIDNLLPLATISSFDPSLTTVQASLTAAQVGVTIATVTNVTNGVNLTTTAVLSNLGASATAQINAEVVDVVNVDTISELSQASPTATPTMRQALIFPYMALRNQVTVSSTQKKFFNDAGTNICTKALSDNGTTYTESEASTGS